MKTLNPPTLMLICAFSMITLHLVMPLWPISSWIFLILGIGFILMGMVLGFAAEGQFTRSGTTVDPFGMPTKLVTDGWFKNSRNPMYLIEFCIDAHGGMVSARICFPASCSGCLSFAGRAMVHPARGETIDCDIRKGL